MLRDPQFVFNHRLVSRGRWLSIMFMALAGPAVAGLHGRSLGVKLLSLHAAGVDAANAPSGSEQYTGRLDLSFCPENTVFVVSVRPAEIFASQQLRSQAKRINDILRERGEAIGLEVEQIEEFMAIEYGEPGR